MGKIQKEIKSVEQRAEQDIKRLKEKLNKAEVIWSSTASSFSSFSDQEVSLSRLLTYCFGKELLQCSVSLNFSDCRIQYSADVLQ